MQATRLAIELKHLKSRRSLFRHLITIMAICTVWLMLVTIHSENSLLRNLSANHGRGIGLPQTPTQYMEVAVVMALLIYVVGYAVCLFQIKRNQVKARQFRHFF